MTKLAYLCGSNSWGGLEMNQLRNAKWMHERGHNVVFLCWENSILFEKAKVESFKTIPLKKHKKYYDFKAGKDLLKILLNENITHLLLRSTFDLSIGAYVKFKLKSKLHLSYFMEMQFGVKKTNPFHTFRFKFLDLWSCPLHFLENQVKTLTRYDHNKIKVIPSAIDISQLDLPINEIEARIKLDIPLDMLTFGLIGRIDPQKGQKLVLEAVTKCQNKNFNIIFLGEPTKNEGLNYFNELQQYIQENDLKNRVFIRPFRSDISTFYKGINWFIMASKAETFGMVTIEAMACGTPTLGSNAGGTPEILEFGELGELFKTLDSEDLAQQIDLILNDNVQINPNRLKEKAKIYCHNTVCKQVESALNI